MIKTRLNANISGLIIFHNNSLYTGQNWLFNKSHFTNANHIQHHAPDNSAANKLRFTLMANVPSHPHIRFNKTKARSRNIWATLIHTHTMYIRNMYVFANNVIKISHLEWLVNFWCINPKDDDVKRCDDAHELYPSKWLLSFKNMSAECEIKRTREMTNGGAEWWSGGRCGVWRNWIEGSFLSERNKKGVQGEHHYHHYHHHQYRISELMFYV